MGSKEEDEQASLELMEEFVNELLEEYSKDFVKNMGDIRKDILNQIPNEIRPRLKELITTEVILKCLSIQTSIVLAPLNDEIIPKVLERFVDNITREIPDLRESCMQWSSR